MMKVNYTKAKAMGYVFSSGGHLPDLADKLECEQKLHNVKMFRKMEIERAKN